MLGLGLPPEQVIKHHPDLGEHLGHNPNNQRPKDQTLNPITETLACQVSDPTNGG